MMAADFPAVHPRLNRTLSRASRFTPGVMVLLTIAGCQDGNTPAGPVEKTAVAPAAPVEKSKASPSVPLGRTAVQKRDANPVVAPAKRVQPNRVQPERKEFEAKAKAAQAKFKLEQARRVAVAKNETSARSFAAQKNWPQAIKSQREAVRLQPEDRRMRYMLGITLLQAKRQQEAKAVFQKLAGTEDQFGANAKRLIQRIDSDPR